MTKAKSNADRQREHRQRTAERSIRMESALREIMRETDGTKTTKGLAIRAIAEAALEQGKAS